MECIKGMLHLINGMRWFKIKWIGFNNGVKEKVKESLSPEVNLKKKLTSITSYLNVQNNKLDVAAARLREKDRYYYLKVLDSLKVGNREKAIVYANELAEVRKALKTISYIRIAIEQVTVRLSTVKAVGEAAAIIAPAIKVVDKARSTISDILPQAEREFTNVIDQLNGVLIETMQMGGATVNFSASNMEAEKILNKAVLQVEEEMRAKLPPVPLSMEELSREEIAI